MKNAMQLKAIIKSIAKEKNASAQLIMQNYMLERLLERISVSRFKGNFILKGGFLIAAMVGLDTRTTMDMDATIKSYPVSEETIKSMFEEICSIDLDDDITFSFRQIGEIREGDEYDGYRVSLTANYPPMAVPLKLDITTGDKITPKEIAFSYKLLLEEREIPILAYNLETILAEKLESVLSRSDQNTRPRDYYDIYVLTKLQCQNIDFAVLNEALHATFGKRDALDRIEEYPAIMDQVRNSSVMQDQWTKYRREFDYAADISFDDTCDAVLRLMKKLDEVHIEAN